MGREYKYTTVKLKRYKVAEMIARRDKTINRFSIDNDISPGVLYCLLAGTKKRTTVLTAVRIADALGVLVDDIVEREEIVETD